MFFQYFLLLGHYLQYVCVNGMLASSPLADTAVVGWVLMVFQQKHIAKCQSFRVFFTVFAQKRYNKGTICLFLVCDWPGVLEKLALLGGEG